MIYNYWITGEDPDKAETFDGPFKTRKDAIEYASTIFASGYTYCLFNARYLPLRDNVFEPYAASYLLDLWIDGNQDVLNPDEVIQPSPEAKRELISLISGVFQAWREKHNIGRPWALDLSDPNSLKEQRVVGDGKS